MPSIDSLFDQLLARGGGDLHVSADYPPMTRVLGELVPMDDALLDAHAVQDLLLPILSPAQRTRFNAEPELDFTHAYGAQARFRATYFHKVSGIAAVFRTVPLTVPSLAELGVPDAARRLAERRSGLVLVTGPASAGKSTTVAAMVRHVNEARACHVLCIEDPVEFVHPPRKAQVTHRDAFEHASGFAAAIAGAARDDADVVMLGELREPATVRLAVELAASGLLVLASIRAHGVQAALHRVEIAFPEAERPRARGVLAECLAGVVAQHLLSTADGSGQAPAHEVLLSTPPVQAILREGRYAGLEGAMKYGQSVGMQTLDHALDRLVQQRRITLEASLPLYADRDAVAPLGDAPPL
jgi:twitching motility protein PilT